VQLFRQSRVAALVQQRLPQAVLVVHLLARLSQDGATLGAKRSSPVSGSAMHATYRFRVAQVMSRRVGERRPVWKPTAMPIMQIRSSA
jgi:hypothetical protein